MTLSFVPGQPCWFDMSVKDASTREALMSFFGDLFGWTFDVGGPETGNYTMALLDGSPVCAIGEQPDGMGVWVTYLNAPDIEDAIGKIGASGGQVFLGPMQVMDVGSMALGMDPAGAVFGLWQKAEFGGFETFGRAGAPCWFDHQSPAPAIARDFYTSVFGLGFNQVADDGQGMVMTGDAQLSSISKQPEEGMPASWNPVIAVASVDEAEAKAAALGATVLMSRMPVPGGIASAFATPITGTSVLVFESTDQPSA
jgi:predicted enzyme related to lactoylglutathione lyase